MKLIKKKLKEKQHEALSVFDESIIKNERKSNLKIIETKLKWIRDHRCEWMDNQIFMVKNR